MHLSLAHQVKPGQTYFVAFPKWSTDYSLKAHENWHATSVLQTLEGTDTYFRPDTKRVDVPLMTRALVIEKPGKGKHTKAVLEMYNREHTPEYEVLCLVTTPDGHSFQAVVSVSSLWKQNPSLEHPPTVEEQGVDPNWTPVPKPGPVEKEKDPHLEACYFFRMLDRMSEVDLYRQLHTCLNLRHSNGRIQGRKEANDACRDVVYMIRAKRAVMNATPEERAKYRLDE